jgi:hypothetical protein
MTTTSTIPTTPIINTTIYFGIELTIDRNFTQDLNNSSSILYKQYVENITIYIQDALESKNLTGFDSLYVAYFTPGSIVASMLLGYVEASDYPVSESDIGTALAAGDLTNLPIVIENIIITELEPCIFVEKFLFFI